MGNFLGGGGGCKIFGGFEKFSEGGDEKFSGVVGNYPGGRVDIFSGGVDIFREGLRFSLGGVEIFSGEVEIFQNG